MFCLCQSPWQQLVSPSYLSPSFSACINGVFCMEELFFLYQLLSLLLWMDLREGGLLWLTVWEDMARHGRGVMVTGIWGGWHTASTVRRWRDECRCTVHFLLLIQPRTPVRGGAGHITVSLSCSGQFQWDATTGQADETNHHISWLFHSLIFDSGISYYIVGCRLIELLL